MCRRFMAMGVNVIGSAIEAGPRAGGRSVGLVPGDMPAGTTSPASRWHAAPTAVALAELQVAGPVEESGVGVVTPAIAAI